MTPTQVIFVALIGLIAGVLGGLAGIGGSLIMIPGLALLLGYSDASHSEHHLYMAAAMVVNVLVSAPAALRHHKARSVRLDLVRIILPTMILTILAGVVVSNMIDGTRLKLFLAAFIALYAGATIVKVFRKQAEWSEADQRVTPPKLIFIGSSTGFVGGLLGIGGGIVMVPMLQSITRVPLRQAIGTSSAIMMVTAIAGSALKLSTLASQGQSPYRALWMAVGMGPTAVVGGWLGAKLTHTLPLQWVRAAISTLLLIAAAKLADLI